MHVIFSAYKMVQTRSKNYSSSNIEFNSRTTVTEQEITLTSKMTNGSSILKRHTAAESKSGLSKGSESKSNGKKITYDDETLGKTNKTVYLVFFSLLMDLLAFTMILPLLPSLLDYYRLNDSVGLYSWLSDNVKSFQGRVGAPERFNSVLFGGALGSMYSFLQFVASPIVGGLSDVYGRRPMMLISLVSNYLMLSY